MTRTIRSKEGDWVSDSRAYLIAWGLPTFALLVGIVLPPAVRTILWSTALIWMGTACILNALRCGRMHCYLTGPFFLVMAAAVLLYGFGILPLGPHGWMWLGLTLIVVGGGLCGTCPSACGASTHADP